MNDCHLTGKQCCIKLGKADSADPNLAQRECLERCFTLRLSDSSVVSIFRWPVPIDLAPQNTWRVHDVGNQQLVQKQVDLRGSTLSDLRRLSMTSAWGRPCFAGGFHIIAFSAFDKHSVGVSKSSAVRSLKPRTHDNMQERLQSVTNCEELR